MIRAFKSTVTKAYVRAVIPGNGGQASLAPTISDIAVSSIGDTGFTIGATINPDTASTVVTIEYGLTNTYGSEQSIVTGSPATVTGAISAVLSGLAQNTTYHYRIKAVNSAGTTYSADATQATTFVSWIIGVLGKTSGTPTNGTLVITTSEDVTPTVTGDATYTIARANDPDATHRKHTLTVSCPNNGSGTIVIPDRSKVLSLGNHNGTSVPITRFYNGTDATMPKITVSDIPSTVEKIRVEGTFTNSLSVTLPATLPSGITMLHFDSSQISWTSTAALPSGITYISLNGFTGTWTYTGALPTDTTYLWVGSAAVAWTYAGALPIGLTVVLISSSSSNWTGLDVGDTGNLATLSLQNYRQAKMSSADMITLLTQLTNRTGTLPATITINDYADYASPPAGVVTAVNTLKSTKSVTTVNLGA